MILALWGILIFLYRLNRGEALLQNDKSETSVSGMSRRDTLFWMAMIILGIATSAIVHVAYYFGNPQKPWIARLTVMYVPVIALWAAYALRRLMSQASVSWLYVVPTLFLLVFYLPQANHNDAGKSLMLAREYKKIRAFFSDKPIDAQLIVAGRPGMYAALGRGAVNFGYANSDTKHLLSDFDRHLFTDVWVIQHVQFESGLPEEDETLDAEFILEPVLEFQNSASEYLRISRLKSQKPLP
jgi:hypothetical protein